MSATADPIDANVRSSRYTIVESRAACPRCHVATKVFAFALPAGYESLNIDDDMPDEERGTWESPGMAAVLSYVEYLPQRVAKQIQALTAHYHLDQEGQSARVFWMNHCEHCGAPLMEEELHGDPDSPFGAMPHEGLGTIRFHQVRESFDAWAGAESHYVNPADS